jgi:hypothetical protein
MYRLVLFLILTSFVQTSYAENIYYYNYPNYQAQRAYSRTPIWRNIANYFGGQPTGYTPPVYGNNYYRPYPQGYDNSSYYEYTSPYGRRIRTKNYGTNSGMGITFLD